MGFQVLGIVDGFEIVWDTVWTRLFGMWNSALMLQSFSLHGASELRGSIFGLYVFGLCRLGFTAWASPPVREV